MVTSVMLRIGVLPHLCHGQVSPLAPGAQTAGAGGGGEGESAARSPGPRLQQGEEGGPAGQVVSDTLHI